MKQERPKYVVAKVGMLVKIQSTYRDVLGRDIAGSEGRIDKIIANGFKEPTVQCSFPWQNAASFYAKDLLGKSKQGYVPLKVF